MTRSFVAKACLAGAGLAVGIAGMATRQRWLVWIAVGLLSVAFVLRFAEGQAGGRR